MKRIILFIIVLTSVWVTWINVLLVSPKLSKEQTVTEVVGQLGFIEKELKHNRLGKKMQQIFPEGLVFVNTLYGLSWCEMVLNAELKDTDLKSKALDEALYAYDILTVRSTTSTFQKSLNPEFGIFYSGWKNYLLSKILLAHPNFKGREIYCKTFKNQCDQIHTALSESKTPFLESYFNYSWPADMSVAMASLSNHDQIFTEKYGNDIQLWILDVKARLDTNTGLIPYKVDSETGFKIQIPRGSGTSLYLRMLYEIDANFGRSQYQKFKENFVSTALTLPCVREYPQETNGLGDIDSGPVILGVGFSATIVSIGTIGIYEDNTLSNQLFTTVNAFGFPLKFEGQKRYVFGMLPMADAFIAWSRASSLNSIDSSHSISTLGWQFQFQLYSTLLLVVVWILYFRKKLLKRFISK